MRSDSNKAFGAWRVYDQGGFFRVTVSETAVSAWAQSWPCFGKPARFAFTFDKRSGDLVELTENGRDCETEHDDSGVAALADDCRDYGFAALHIPNPRKPAKESAALTA